MTDPDKPKAEDNNSPTRHRLMLVLALVFVVVVIIASPLITIRYFGDPESPGTFGDMFGAPNALFSALAFVGLVYAILIQRKDLKSTLDEMAKQNETMRDQSFQSTFFQLLEHHNSIVDKITTSIREPQNQARTVCGRDSFVKLHQDLLSQIKGAKGCNEELLVTVYAKFYEENQSNIGHYFRSLSYLIYEVNQSGTKNPRLFTNLLISQFTSAELGLLFYNCLGEKRQNFRHLIENYGVLKNFSSDLVTDINHLKYYDKEAFGGEYPK